MSRFRPVLGSALVTCSLLLLAQAGSRAAAYVVPLDWLFWVESDFGTLETIWLDEAGAEVRHAPTPMLYVGRYLYRFVPFEQRHVAQCGERTLQITSTALSLRATLDGRRVAIESEVHRDHLADLDEARSTPIALAGPYLWLRRDIRRAACGGAQGPVQSHVRAVDLGSGRDVDGFANPPDAERDRIALAAAASYGRPCAGIDASRWSLAYALPVWEGGALSFEHVFRQRADSSCGDARVGSDQAATSARSAWVPPTIEAAVRFPPHLSGWVAAHRVRGVQRVPQ